MAQILVSLSEGILKLNIRCAQKSPKVLIVWKVGALDVQQNNPLEIKILR